MNARPRALLAAVIALIGSSAQPLVAQIPQDEAAAKDMLKAELKRLYVPTITAMAASEQLKQDRQDLFRAKMELNDLWVRNDPSYPAKLAAFENERWEHARNVVRANDEMDALRTALNQGGGLFRSAADRQQWEARWGHLAMFKLVAKQEMKAGEMWHDTRAQLQLLKQLPPPRPPQGPPPQTSPTRPPQPPQANPPQPPPTRPPQPPQTNPPQPPPTRPPQPPPTQPPSSARCTCGCGKLRSACPPSCTGGSSHSADGMATALQDNQETALNKLVQDLQSSTETTRMMAAKSLGKMGAAARSALPALRKAAEDPDADVRSVALAAIRRIESAGPVQPPVAEPLRSLIEQLQSPEPIERAFALRDLAKLGPTAKEAIPYVEQLAKSNDVHESKFATLVLRALRRPPLFQGGSVAGTMWEGSESLGGFGALTFEFHAGGVAVMVDAKTTVKGRWTQAGDQVTATFENCVYAGTIRDEVLSGEAHYTVGEPRNWTWNVQAGGPAPEPPPSQTATVAGTTWNGSESLAGFGTLTFELQADGRAVMIDAQTTTNGNWSQTGSQVTITFGNCVYVGQLQGNTLSGNARYTVGEPREWTWSVTRKQ